MWRSYDMENLTAEYTGTFNEATYLSTNPDVATAIRVGNFSGTALDHWNSCGKKEGRKGSGMDRVGWSFDSETATIVLIVLGSIIGLVILVVLGMYAYRKFAAPPVYQAPSFGARRR